MRREALKVFPELSPFEQHVAVLLVSDFSRAMIVEDLEVKRATVWTSTHRLLRKLKLEGVAGLTRLAIRRGYIQP